MEIKQNLAPKFLFCDKTYNALMSVCTNEEMSTIKEIERKLDVTLAKMQKLFEEHHPLDNSYDDTSRFLYKDAFELDWTSRFSIFHTAASRTVNELKLEIAALEELTMQLTTEEAKNTANIGFETLITGIKELSFNKKSFTKESKPDGYKVVKPNQSAIQETMPPNDYHLESLRMKIKADEQLLSAQSSSPHRDQNDLQYHPKPMGLVRNDLNQIDGIYNMKSNYHQISQSMSTICTANKSTQTNERPTKAPLSPSKRRKTYSPSDIYSKCHNCTKVLSSEAEGIPHLYTDCPMSCRSCHIVFQGSKLFDRHVCTQSTKKSSLAQSAEFSCSECSFKHREELVRMHVSQRRACMKCKGRFCTRSALYSHMCPCVMEAALLHKPEVNRLGVRSHQNSFSRDSNSENRPAKSSPSHNRTFSAQSINRMAVAFQTREMNP